ncbi:hypothetical protein BGZ65_012032, partial [Modicella reniformis]
MSEQLSWKAPSALRVTAFFNTTPCQNWSDIPQFFRDTKRATVQDYYDAYSRGLECIARYDETPAEVKDKARAILDNTDLETISAKYDSWSLENEKKKAKHIIAKGFVNLAAGAGTLIQDEGSAIAAQAKKMKKSGEKLAETARSSLQRRHSTLGPKWHLESGTVVEDVLLQAGLELTVD